MKRLLAKTYVNKDKNLSVIPDLIVKSFGENFHRISGTCLAHQFCYSVSSTTGIPVEKLVSKINKSDIYGGLRGITLSDLFDNFNNRNFGSKKINLEVETPNLKDSITDVKTGQPIIFIPSDPILDCIDGSVYTSSGVVKSYNAKRLAKSDIHKKDYFHSFLIVGYDEDGFVIIRDSRSSYSYRGYAKVPVEMLEKFPKSYKLLSIITNQTT
jgi:hypothetical protein